MPLFPPPPPAPWLLNESVGTAGTANALTANTVYLIPVEVNAPCVATGIRFRIGTATTPSTSDVGIYDMNGNLLGHSGVVTNIASTTITLSFTSPIVLSPGRYMLAITPGNSTDTYLQGAGISAGLADSYTATNAATAGVLPNATGGMSAANLKISMVGLVQGGAP